MDALPKLTIEERILLILSEHVRNRDDFQVPTALTQEGLSELVGSNRPNIARSLKVLKRKGLVEERLSHVQGQRRRKKVYLVDPFRSEDTFRLRDELKMVKVTFGGARMSLGEVAKERGLLLIQAYSLVQGGTAARTHDTPTGRPVGGAVDIPFFGRESELSSLKGWLMDPGAPFAVIFGMGGIGKTSLIDRFCSTLKGTKVVRYRFLPGSSLEGTIHSLELLLSRPLLGHGRSGSVLPVDIASVLSGMERAVLVLDDLHLSDPAFLDLLRSVLAMDMRGAKVLCASRKKELFYSPRESRILRKVLEVPLAGLDEKDAMTMLSQRGFDARTALSVFRRCRGHPIVLRLAPLDGPADGDAPIGPDAESFMLSEVIGKLSGPELDVMRALSVLRGPVRDPYRMLGDLGTDPSWLDELVLKGLVQRGNMGCEVHPMIGDLVRTRAPSDRLAAIHSAVADHFLKDRATHSSLIEASHHLLGAGRASELMDHLRREGLMVLEEGFMELLVVLGGIDPSTLPVRDRAWYYLLLGTGEEGIGDTARAVLDLNKALGLCRSLEPKDEHLLLGIETSMGRSLMNQGRDREAEDWFRKASMTYDAFKDPDDQDIMKGVWAFNGLGLSRTKNGNIKGALESFTRAESLAAEYDPGNMLSSICGNIGNAHAINGELDKARAAFEKGLEISTSLRDLRTAAKLHESMGELCARTGDLAQAGLHFEKALEHALSSDELRKTSENYLALAEMHRRSMVHPTVKERLFSFLRGKSSEEERDLSRIYNRICQMERARGPLPAPEVHERAASLFKELRMMREAAKALNNLGYARSTRGDLAKAEMAYQEAMEVLGKSRDRRAWAMTASNLGLLLSEKGDPRRAIELLTGALSTMRELGMAKEASEVQRELGAIASRRKVK